MGGGQHFQSLPKSLPSHFRGRDEAWGQIPPPDWRVREVTGSDFWGELSGTSVPTILPHQNRQQVTGNATRVAWFRGRRANVQKYP
jgi:hypothetical protein